MSDKIKAIIVDPYLKMITETTIENNLYGLKHAIGDHYIELVRIDGKNDMYVDEEGLFRENQEYFIITGSERIVPLAGKAVIVGSNHEDGTQIDTSMCVTDVAKMIEFKSRNEMYELSQAGKI